MLFKSRRSSSMSRDRAVTPKVPAKALPDYFMTPKYESDTEPSFTKRMSINPPAIPNSGDHKKSRRGSGSSDGSSRLRAISHISRPSESPLKSCLKTSKVYPEATTPSPVSRDSSRSRRGWSPDAVNVYHQSAIPWGNGLESRRSRHDSAPSGPVLPPSSSTRPHAHHVQSASEGAIPRSHQSLPPPAGRRGGKIGSEPMKVEQISLTWVLINGMAKKRRSPPVFFDVAFDPRRPGNLAGLFHDGVSRRYMPIPNEHLLSHASTHEVMTQMVVHCPRGTLGAAPVMIQRPEGLRVIDVLAGIYDVYHRLVSPEDMMHVGADYYERCIPHFMKRCEELRQYAHQEERKGMRYVDLLRGSRRRIFKGLKQRPGPGLSWDLVFEDPE